MHPLDRSTLTASDLYARAHGYRIKLVESEREREDAWAVRHDVYVESGYLEPQTPPLFKDKFDDRSVLFVAYRGDECVGTLRLTDVRDEAALLEYFNVDVSPCLTPSGLTVEIGRFAVRREHRSVERVASLGLARQAYEYSVTHHIERWAGSTNQALLRSFRPYITWRVLEEKPLEPRHLKAREELAGYFDHHRNLTLFCITLREIQVRRWWGITARLLWRRRFSRRRRR